MEIRGIRAFSAGETVALACCKEEQLWWWYMGSWRVRLSLATAPPAREPLKVILKLPEA